MDKNLLVISFIIFVSLFLANQIVYADITDINAYFNFPAEALGKMTNEEIIVKAEFPIAKIDPVPINDYISYPGMRGPNELVIYTANYGLRTGTNEFGTEAVVQNNKVIKFSGADSIIPYEGFVISGHGKAKDWIIKNIRIGSEIQINTEEKKIIVYVTPSTYLYEAQEKIQKINNIMNYYMMTYSNYKYRNAQNYLKKAKNDIKKAEKYNSLRYALMAIEETENALNYALPYLPNERKGIWIRPTEKNIITIRAAVERLKYAGITDVYLETFYHGYTIYPSDVMKKYGFQTQRPEFASYDILKAWSDLCRQNNIRLHIWFQCFYVGNENPKIDEKSILAVYPKWANKTKNMMDSEEFSVSKAEHNGYFLDPSNPEVTKFLTDLLNEIIEKYQPYGINLDYIRYPLNGVPKTKKSVVTQWGYTEYARNKFLEIYGVDPAEIPYDDVMFSVWEKFRQNQITNFVKSIRSLTAISNVELSTVIFPEQETVLRTKMQDWKAWDKYGYVDAFTPLIMTNDSDAAYRIANTLKNQINNKTKIYPGLFVMFMDGNSENLLYQIHEMRRLDFEGVILFDYAHMQDKYVTSMTSRVFNKNKKDN